MEDLKGLDAATRLDRLRTRPLLLGKNAPIRPHPSDPCYARENMDFSNGLELPIANKDLSLLPT